MLKGSVDITLFKGGGEPAPNELVIDNVSRNAPSLQNIHLAVSPRWKVAMQEQERIRIETETFAHAALRPLLEGGYDIIHCLEQEVCNRLYGFRHLFAHTPKFLFSNGGAIPAAKLSNCDFVQEHTEYNLQHSAREKLSAFPTVSISSVSTPRSAAIFAPATALPRMPSSSSASASSATGTSAWIT